MLNRIAKGKNKRSALQEHTRKNLRQVENRTMQQSRKTFHEQEPEKVKQLQVTEVRSPDTES